MGRRKRKNKQKKHPKQNQQKTPTKTKPNKTRKKNTHAKRFPRGLSQENTGTDYQKTVTSILGPVLVSILINIFLKGGKVNTEVTFTGSIILFMFFKTTAHFIESLKNLKMLPD